MPRGSKSAQSANAAKEVTAYPHRDKTRANNPEVGAVNSTNDPQGKPKTYEYDPHLDPALVWAGKAEHTSFEVPTVSLHVHERVEPLTLIKAMEKDAGLLGGVQGGLFDDPEEREIRRRSGKQVGYYTHPLQWKNRLVAGDSLLVINSLLEKEGMAGQVQMVYIDPPYGIKYGSNFQPFTNRRDVKDGKDDDLTNEPEMIKAFRDTWELGVHSYLTYLRDRLLLTRELLHDTGSCFVQISDENVHHVRELMDEIFGPANFVSEIFCQKTTGAGSPGELLSPASVGDYIVWYAKDFQKKKYHPLFKNKELGGEASSSYSRIELADGRRMSISQWEKMSQSKFDWAKIPMGAKIFALGDLTSQSGGENARFDVQLHGKTYKLSKGSWKTSRDGILNLIKSNRIEPTPSGSIGYVRYFEDFPCTPIHRLWTDTVSSFMSDKVYVVQTNTKILQRCILMTTDPGDLVLDPTCGSGTTAVVAEEWGRRWITCDTSRVALTLARQRLMTNTFEYYELARPEEGVSGGFKYKTVPHVTLKSIATNEPATPETLYDQPLVDKSKIRVTGPFTMEAVPAPVVGPLEGGDQPPAADASLAREGATVREADWRAELQRAGILLKGGKKISFTRVEPLPGSRCLHAVATTEDGKIAAVAFGSDHAPMTPGDVERAYTEARQLKPDYMVYAAFQFDPEAAKDIDELNPQLQGFQSFKVAMNPDLLTTDLRKKQSSSQSFWLLGRPDIVVRKLKEGDDKGKWQVEVRGFDYLNPTTSELESGGTDRVAMWSLDSDYDDRSLFPRQVFFPLAGEKDGWNKLRKDLKAQLDEYMLEAFTGCISLPFEGEERQTRIAVKMVDNRGLESLRVLTLGETAE